MGRQRATTMVSVLFVLASVLGSCATEVPKTTLAEEYFNLGNGWYEQKKFDRAAQAYERALRWNPNLDVATLNLARTRAETGDVAGALDLIEKLPAQEQENLIVAQYRAWLKGKKDGLAAAADLYLALARQVPDAATLYNAGLCLQAARRHAEAVDHLDRWKALDGKRSPGLVALAESLEALGSDRAPAAWLDAALVFPDHDVQRFAPLARRAALLEAAHRYGEAVSTWDEALALPANPGRPGGLFARGRILLLHIEDFPEGSQGVIAAWNEGYRDARAWAALRLAPELKFSPQLEAALRTAKVNP